MRNFLRFCTVLLAAATLAACASKQARVEAAVGRGESSFKQQDYHKAFKQLEPQAQAGNADAQYAIAYLYFYGQGVVENKAMAKKWMRKAARQGHPLARKALGILESEDR